MCEYRTNEILQWLMIRKTNNDQTREREREREGARTIVTTANKRAFGCDEECLCMHLGLLSTCANAYIINWLNFWRVQKQMLVCLMENNR